MTKGVHDPVFKHIHKFLKFRIIYYFMDLTTSRQCWHPCNVGAAVERLSHKSTLLGCLTFLGQKSFCVYNGFGHFWSHTTCTYLILYVFFLSSLCSHRPIYIFLYKESLWINLFVLLEKKIKSESICRQSSPVDGEKPLCLIVKSSANSAASHLIPELLLSLSRLPIFWCLNRTDSAFHWGVWSFPFHLDTA